MDESLKPKRGKQMPDEETKLREEQEKNWEMLRNHPANQDLSRDPKASLDSLGQYGIPGGKDKVDDDEDGTPHTELSERL